MRKVSNEYRQELKEAVREGQWTFWTVASRVIFSLVILAILLGGIGWMIKMLSRPAAVVDIVTDPNRVIQTYEWFEESYNDSLALDKKIAATQAQMDAQFKDMPADRNSWSRANQTEYNRLNAVITGMRTQREGIVADYNAKSKMITRQMWKSPSLPYQLTIVDDQTKEKITND